MSPKNIYKKEEEEAKITTVGYFALALSCNLFANYFTLRLRSTSCPSPIGLYFLWIQALRRPRLFTVSRCNFVAVCVHFAYERTSHLPLPASVQHSQLKSSTQNLHCRLMVPGGQKLPCPAERERRTDTVVIIIIIGFKPAKELAGHGSSHRSFR